MAAANAQSRNAAPASPTVVHTNPPAQRRQQASRPRFVADLSQCLFDFVIQLLPTPEELSVKEDVRKLLERLIRTIEPDSRLLSFGSTANGFSLRNSDMDLCCLTDAAQPLPAADLVTMLGDLLERETKFHVKPLPYARIPIVKLSLDPSSGLPLGIACDIGFENRLALENTRLLYCYATIDPTRVRTLVLFLKVWCKRRKINSPYKGTLSSYGYVLLVIYYLVHVKNPPVLPNLQQMPPLRPISREDTHIGENNTWFFDDIELLRQRWQSANSESVSQLLIDFFKYFSRDFLYNSGVASIRAGLIKKDAKGWQNDLSESRFKDPRERNRFCIEDPFETDFNVARCVTRDGLYTIRGEFMRASRILAARPDRAILAIAQLCEERVDNLNSPSSSSPRVPSVPPRLSPLPPQTPYTVGSSPVRTPAIQMPAPDRLSPRAQFSDRALQPSNLQAGPSKYAPEHMEPKRSKWTSPPPPEAPVADHTSFDDRLGLSLVLATASTDAREQEAAYTSSSNNSDILTDDDHLDEVRSVRSMMSEDPLPCTARLQTSGMSGSLPPSSPLSPLVPNGLHSLNPVASGCPSPIGGGVSPLATIRGLPWGRLAENNAIPTPQSVVPPRRMDRRCHSSRFDSPRRSLSGPPAPSLKSSPIPSLLPLALATPLPPSPQPAGASPSTSYHQPHVLYETYGTKEIIPHHSPVQPINHKLPQYLSSQSQRPYISAPQAFSVPIVSNKRRSKLLEVDGEGHINGLIPSPTATPTSHTHFAVSYPHSHAHSHSTATVIALTPPATAHRTLFPSANRPSSSSRSRSPTNSPSQRAFFPEDHLPDIQPRSISPHESNTSAGSGSPAPSSTSSQYASASPLSTSPSSPTQAVEFEHCAHGLPPLDEIAEDGAPQDEDEVSWRPRIQMDSKGSADTVTTVLAPSTETLVLEAR